MRRSGFRVRDSKLGKLVGWGLLVVFSTAALAAHPRDERKETGLKITVRIQDYAQVAPSILSEAKREATRILSATGIEVAWVKCTGTGLPSEPMCAQPFRATNLALRILPQAMAEHLPLNSDAFGFAAISTGDRPSFLASVSYHRVEALSNALGYSRSATLGYVMAHEIGHLLLRRSGHPPFGIMRARLTREDLLRPLRFNADQAAIIRADVRARNESDSVARLAVAAPQ